MRPALPPFRTLRTKLTVLYAGFFTIGLLALTIVAQLMVEKSARDTATAELVTSGTIYDRLWQERERSLAGAANVVARDFGFRAAVATRDVATIASALDSLRARAGVPHVVFVAQDGQVIGDPGVLKAAVGRLVTAVDDDRRHAVIATAAGVQRIVTAPVLAPLELGHIAFVLPLDAREMRDLEKLFAIPLNAEILIRSPSGAWSDGTETVTAGPAGTVRAINTAAGESFAMLRPLPGTGRTPQAALLLSYPMARAMASYRSIQVGLVAAGLAWLAMVILGSGRLAGGITRPIVALDAAAQRLEGGGHAEVAVDSGDEVGRLTQSFNRMSRGIREREARISHLAFHDGLTDLPNRVFFHQSLEQALARAARSGERIGVLCLDLAGFKTVNDMHGHPVGDALLRQVGVRLLDLTENAMVARLGGDEFAVVVTETEDLMRSRRIARALIDSFAEPVEVAGHSIATGVSIGIAMFPADGVDAAILLKHADLARYRAKQEGCGRYSFFEQALDEAARRRREIETDLRAAIRTGGLDLHFQPIVYCGSGAIKGFEALLRWPHPERGDISPVEFIPVAEETGLIVALGEWVLHEACRVASNWPEHVTVAVNVSPLQFRSQGFRTVVLQALARSGLSPTRLEMEITESVFLDGETGVLQILHMLRMMGVRIALDDFGTGYSSLSYLRSFPFDKIKIDRSFVTNIANDMSACAIVKAIVDLAAALGMETTAEGVEDAEQYAELRRQGCDTLQGYLFSRPLTVTAAFEYIHASDGYKHALPS